MEAPQDAPHPPASGFRVGVNSLPVAPSTRARLEAAGFYNRGDLENIGPVDLAREAELTHDEALAVLQECGHQGADRVPAPVSALDLLREERSRRHIKTLCPELDELLGGGVAPGEITEICGGPGLGKTQLCIQLAVNAQLPVEFGGVGGDTLYIDTEGSLMPERVADMAASAGAHLRMHYTAGGGGQGQQQALPPFVDAWTPDAVLSRIHVYRAHDAVTQTAICAALPGLIAARPRVKLVVLDSVAFHYRHGWSSDYAARARSLAACFNSMLKFAAQHGIAVVVTNQVTTKPGAAGVGGLMGGGSKLAPALGESFAHCATCRLLLFWQHRSRCALLFKSPRQPRGTAAYAITPDGVRPLRTLKRHATDAAAPGRQ